jgi:hypothetical protein
MKCYMLTPLALPHAPRRARAPGAVLQEYRTDIAETTASVCTGSNACRSTVQYDAPKHHEQPYWLLIAVPACRRPELVHGPPA